MDSYIDNDETQDYGPRFSANLRRLATDATPSDALLLWCADEIDRTTSTMRSAMATARRSRSAESAAAAEKVPAVVEARDELRTFYLHLKTCRTDKLEPWSGDLALFFPRGLGGVRGNARSVRHSLDIAHEQLKVDETVPERARWLKRLSTQHGALSALTRAVEEHGFARVSALSEQSAEKLSWLRSYRAAALVVEGVLLLRGQEDSLASVVPHLSAPGARKKTDGTPNAPTPQRPVAPSPAP